MSAEKYVMFIVNRVKKSDIDTALMSVPFSKLQDFLTIILACLREGVYTDICLNVVSILLKIHFGEVRGSGTCKSILGEIKIVGTGVLSVGEGVLGFNLGALSVLRREVEGRGEVGFGLEGGEKEVVVEKNAKGGEKRKRVVIR